MNPQAPVWDFFDGAYLGVWRRLGAKVRAEVWRHGFPPEAGGALRVFVKPGTLAPAAIVERGKVLARRALVRLSKVPARIGERALAVLEGRLRWGKPAFGLDEVEAESIGNLVVVTIKHEHVTHVDAQLHDPEQPAEVTAHALANRVDLYLAGTAPVSQHLADQILVPMAVAGGGSFRTFELTRHAHTTIDVVQAFLPELKIEARDLGDRTCMVSLRRA
jgi:RNA 3'-terminal phosphate cyclase (ATP)